MSWKYIMIHCTATPEGKDYTVKEIDRWHREKGFNGIGYHYVIHLNGCIEEGRPITRAGAHCYGWNSSAIGIAYIGGTDADGTPKDTRTEAQKKAIRQLVERFKELIPIKRVLGHNEVSNKACPCFDVGKEFA
ncbi:N-acetylmuramoyl-L-alanine amidase [Bacteroides sp. 224]|uniref:N-acetylmuramoyl-L-alanine amidase n=1 Tax=Bacteroides sp. 224 TaxID=2302936 RepID=UPI0013D021F0|nr:N-acetylmuramoyl-L-alanine amidase [Bacteroides sp. 224]NDV66429.1 N-acetylmuramoyl-L-alanine amidase [Bacteroides sp. 224]